jgi:thiol:disulfide interchange protein
MKAYLFFIFLAPIFLNAQVNSINVQSVATPTTCDVAIDRPGVLWTDNLNWQQVRKLAKKENKYIFVDCYATWCKPCKKMDKNVYTNDSVGALLNARFISVKVQMDSTKADNECTRKWYRRAKRMRIAYDVSTYPTFLFFAPNGKIVIKTFATNRRISLCRSPMMHKIRQSNFMYY